MIYTQNSPQSLEEIIHNKSLIEYISNIDSESFRSTILYGPNGVGKTTITKLLLEKNFNKKLNYSYRQQEIELPSKTIKINFYESEDVIWIDPSILGYSDKNVIQEFINKVANTRTLKSVIKNRDCYRVIVFKQAEKLTKLAQASLRVTIEACEKNVKFIFLTEDIDNVIDPIQSRMNCLRVGKPTKEEIQKILTQYTEKQKLKISQTLLEQLAEKSDGNLTKAFSLFEKNSNIFQENCDENSKKAKMSLNLRLWHEKEIDSINSLIMSSQTADSVLKIREKLKDLITKGIPSRTIIDGILNYFIKMLKNPLEITKLYTVFVKRLNSNGKELFHLEAFVLGTMCEVKKIKSNRRK